MSTDAREALAERMIEGSTAALEMLSIHLGLTLGLYTAVAELGDATAARVADRAGVAPRYAREWLEQQVTAGLLECPEPALPAAERRFRLAPAHAEVLLDPDSAYHVAPVTHMLAGVAGVLPDLAAAYRAGGGVPYAAYGAGIRDGIGGLNGPMFRHELTGWLAALPEVDRRLRAPGARVLDLGCGTGASTLVLAAAYPDATVLGLDLDPESIAAAGKAASAAGLGDRVRFAVADAADAPPETGFDLVTLFETLHDMGDPVGALRSARTALAPGGTVLIGDERVADDLAAPGELLERFQFGWSVLHCLPATLAENPVEANGTMLRASTVHRWAAEAGFARSDVAPIDNDFWRFYTLG